MKTKTQQTLGLSKKTIQQVIYIDKEIKEKIVFEAKKQGRSTSNMINHIISEYITNVENSK